MNKYLAHFLVNAEAIFFEHAICLYFFYFSILLSWRDNPIK